MERRIQIGIGGKVELGAYTLYTIPYASNNQFLRCMEHALHLGAGHFIRVVSPTSGRILVKKIKKAVRDAKLDDDNIDFNVLEADLGGDNSYNDSDESAASEAADFTVGDTIGKSLALVKQVSLL
jgi:hypothetical protein